MPLPEEQTPSLVKQQILKVLRSLISSLQAIADNLDESLNENLEASSLTDSQTSRFPLWDRFLGTVRRGLPRSWNQKLNNFDLGAGVITGMAIALAIVVALIPNHSPDIAQVPTREPSLSTEPIEPPLVTPEPSAIALQPEPEVIPEEELEENQDENLAPVEEIESEISEPSEPSEPIIEAVPEESITEIPEELELEKPPEPIPVDIAPPPPPVLTPEQRLIVTIQNQVSSLTQQYEQGLINSIQADFLNSILVIKVDTYWYELPLDRQKKLANDMFKRAKNLDFTRLEVTDIEGNLLARNPAIGNNMVIIKPKEFNQT